MWPQNGLALTINQSSYYEARNVCVFLQLANDEWCLLSKNRKLSSLNSPCNIIMGLLLKLGPQLLTLKIFENCFEMRACHNEKLHRLQHAVVPSWNIV